MTTQQFWNPLWLICELSDRAGSLHEVGLLHTAEKLSDDELSGRAGSLLETGLLHTVEKLSDDELSGEPGSPQQTGLLKPAGKSEEAALLRASERTESAGFLRNAENPPQTGLPEKPAAPRVTTDEDLVTVRADEAGFFETKVQPGEHVSAGEEMALITDTYDSHILGKIITPCAGTVLFMHSEDICYAKSAVFKIIRDES